MVGNFREVFIFAFFVNQEPFAKIKTAKILLPTCKANEPRFNPWPTSLQKCVSECAFDGYMYHWSNTDARSRQRRNCHGSQFHRSWKLKLQKFLKSEFWPISWKFVPVKITNHTVLVYTMYVFCDCWGEPKRTPHECWSTSCLFVHLQQDSIRSIIILETNTLVINNRPKLPNWGLNPTVLMLWLWAYTNLCYCTIFQLMVTMEPGSDTAGHFQCILMYEVHVCYNIHSTLPY